MLNAPGWSEIWFTNMPNSLAIRSRSLCSHDDASNWAAGIKPFGMGWVAGGVVERSSSSGSDSPKSIERRSSSMPIKSRMTLRVIRFQKVSLSKSTLPSCSESIVLNVAISSCSRSCTKLRLSVDIDSLRLRVSLCISSTSTRLCSILHFSILRIRSASTALSLSSSSCPNSRLSLRLFTRLGLYLSNAYKCSCTSSPDLSTRKLPRPSCIGNIVPLASALRLYTLGSDRNSCR